MDKQQFDHIDNRFRQAADEIAVPFSEEAWKNMEVKLDNEFNKDRRRGIIWWWFSLMLLGLAVAGVYFYNYKSVPSKNIAGGKSSLTNTTFLNKNIVPDTHKQKDENIKESNFKKAKNNIPADRDDKTFSKNKTPDSPVSLPLSYQTVKLKKNNIKKHRKLVTSDVITGLSGRNNSLKETTRPPNAGSDNSLTIIKSNELKFSDQRSNDLTQNSHNKKPVNTDSSFKELATVYDSSPSASLTKHANISDPVVKNDSVASPDSVSKKKTPVKLDSAPSKGSYFLAFVAGEATGTKNISIKDAKPFYGIGIGYRFNKRLSVQTGFSFGKKVYFAGSDDYKVKAGSYIAKFISAEAECYIYDIPVTLRYDVLHKKNFDFYFTTGLSSFILKRETYDMHFFNPSGMYRHMIYAYKHNAAYFSVFNLSAGYEHKLSNALSVLAEPYLKLPLSGSGEGSVKLSSAGLQVGLKYHPLKINK